MIASFRHIWMCFIGPRLYKIHPDDAYSPRAAEIWGDRAIACLNLAWKIGVYASPLVGLYAYRKEYSGFGFATPALKFVAGVGLFAFVSVCSRGYGRLANPRYDEFIRALALALTDPKSNDAIRKYDFDFDAWPVDFDCGLVKRADAVKYSEPKKIEWRNAKDAFFGIVALAAVKTFGLRLVYPGSTSLLMMFVENTLLEGRRGLVEEHHGKRYKVKTGDGNCIDSMFIDRRNISSNGKTLVITSEGNAGFYEIGIMVTPIQAGYSVLGWNHPGFASSTGQPYPLQEQHAINAIMRFAIDELKFMPSNIVLFGWSIGCYSVAWAATQYPDIKGVVLDATFDDILPLAIAHMPSSWNHLVHRVIREHIDLNIAEILRDYCGPLKLIRRTLDEVISLREGNLSSNRGNDLLIKILAHRYPDLFGIDQYNLLHQYLSLRGADLTAFVLSDHPGDMDKNKKILFLVEKYLKDYNSTHCTPLPPEYFALPREVTIDEDFVFT